MSTNCIYCSEKFDSEEELNKHLSICKSIKELLDNMTPEMRQELEKNIIRDIDSNNKDVYKECPNILQEGYGKHKQRCIKCQIKELRIAVRVFKETLKMSNENCYR